MLLVSILSLATKHLSSAIMTSLPSCCCFGLRGRTLLDRGSSPPGEVVGEFGFAVVDMASCKGVFQYSRQGFSFRRGLM